jgi:hypothetical protein
MSDKVKKGSGAPKKDSWHPHYNDPVHKLVLKSTDNVLFRVSAYHLAKARSVHLCSELDHADALSSPVFAEMFDLTLEDTKPVDMLVSSKVLCEFIYRTTCPYSEDSHSQRREVSWTLDEAFELYHIGSRFECPLAKASGLSQIRLRSCGSLEFWHALIRASNEDGEPLAKEIIQFIAARNMVKRDPFPFISQLQITWQHSLLRSLFGIAPHGEHRLDLRRYRGLPMDLSFSISADVLHGERWKHGWEPSGQSDAAL